MTVKKTRRRKAVACEMLAIAIITAAAAAEVKLMH